MKRTICLALLLSFAAALAVSAGIASTRQPEPLRIFLRGGPKTHGPAGNGLHDHEVWLKDWQPLLASRGATVDGALRFPTPAQLDNADVLVMFAANAGTILGDQRASLERFLTRGGGIVVIHDALVAGQDPHWFKTIVGGAWENKVARYFEGENTFYYVTTEHPISKGASNFRINDEVYWNLHMMPAANVLAVSMEPKPKTQAQWPAGGEQAIDRLIPQIWVYENQLEGGKPYRAYVNLLGHHYRTFSSPHVRGTLLRGIAWAGRRDPDSLATPEEIAALR